MPKYLDMSAHYEVNLDEVLGVKKPQPKPEDKKDIAIDETKKEVKKE